MTARWGRWLSVGFALFAGAAVAASPVALTAQPDIAPGLAAFPRIAAPAAPAAPAGAATARINQALSRADARVMSPAQDCKANVVAQNMESPGEPDWERDVTVTMQGPDYLALVANDFMSCGGAHPDVEFVVLAYDLQTGRPMNWLRLLPASFKATGSLDQAADGTNIGLVASKVLTDLFTKASVADGGSECLDVLQGMDLKFIMWPDAQADGIDLFSPDIPHVMAPCAGPEVIPLAKLRALGFNGGLLDAIATAHQAGWFQKTQ